MANEQLKFKVNAGQFSGLFTNLAIEPRIKPLYYNWIQFNIPYYTKYFTLLTVLIYVLLIPFDFLLFDDGIFFVRQRVLLISLLLILVLLYNRYSSPLDNLFNYQDYKLNGWLLAPSLFVNLHYIYFLTIAKAEDFIIVLLGYFLIILISTLFMYRFWKEQYFINAVSCLILLIIPFYRPELGQNCNRLIIFQVISFLVAFYYRNQFLDNLYKRFVHLSSLLPMKIARAFSISDGRGNLEEIFQSKERYTVCLCSDWRDYQKITQELDHENLANLIEKFYDIIFEKLEDLFSEGDYYVDWSADELFIVFYSEDGSNTAIQEKALKFAHALSTEIYVKIAGDFEIKLKYDIGLASGMGFIGLQGPKRMKKTTITGETAGIAKRLQTQGKKLRSSGQVIRSFPQIIMDPDLYKVAVNLQAFKKQKFKDIKGTEKNIKDNDYYHWQYSD